MILSYITQLFKGSSIQMPSTFKICDLNSQILVWYSDAQYMAWITDYSTIGQIPTTRIPN